MMDPKVVKSPTTLARHVCKDNLGLRKIERKTAMRSRISSKLMFEAVRDTWIAGTTCSIWSYAGVLLLLLLLPLLPLVFTATATTVYYCFYCLLLLHYYYYRYCYCFYYYYYCYYYCHCCH